MHSAIRMVFAEEDPLAILLLVQSAEKVCLDLLKVRRIRDPIQFEERIRPELRKAFFEAHREAYNFLKHANEDAADTLTVYDTVGSNDLLLLSCVSRYRSLFGTTTTHMNYFFGFSVTLFPNLLEWAEIPDSKRFLEERAAIKTATRGDFLKVVRAHLERDPAYAIEKREERRSGRC